MAAPFVAVPENGPFTGRLWDCPVPARTRQYGVLRLPKAPVFHPYHPYGFNERSGKDAVQVSMNFHFPKDFFEALPSALAARIRAQGLGRDQVDVFWEVQDQPWTGIPLLLRPHYWCDPEAPMTGHRNQNFPIQVSLFEAPAGVHFAGHEADAFLQAAIQVHGPEQGEGTILSSPDNLAVEGLDPGTTWTFWTLTQLGQRAAATLHVLLNDADQAEFDGLALREGNLRKLVGALDQSELLRGTPMVAQLKRLTRPLITSRELLPEVQEQAPKLVIRGSGFTGATAITVGGEPGSRLQVLDDNTVTLEVPEGVTHSDAIVITTPMGVSQAPGAAGVAAPVPLWQRGARHDLVVPAAGGTVGVYQTLPCAAGEVFEGRGFVRTEGMTQGRAMINLQFTRAGGPCTYGQPLGPALPLSSLSTDRVPLGVRGTAPEGASQVMFYLQEHACNPGARAVFDEVTFGRVLPAAPPPPPPNLWRRGAEPTLVVPPDGGTPGLYQSQACVPGEVFEGTCDASTEGMTRGQAQINMQFTGPGLAASYGTPLGPGQALSTRAPARVALGVRGTAPAGATQVQFYLQEHGCNPGARATFGKVVFVKRVAP